MKISVLAPALLLTAAISLTGCSGDDGPTSANDPAAGGGAGAKPAPPTAVPAAPGQVRSANLATVMDTGSGAELCLGAIAESYPPQCSGPAITNWVWKDYRGTFEQQGSTRWATYAVTGTWDGTAFTVTEAIMGALWDPMRLEPPVLAEPSVDYTAAELEAISEGLSDELPGYQGSYPDQDGHVLADVTYDDGTLQAWADEAYGDDVVVISGALVDAG